MAGRALRCSAACRSKEPNPSAKPPPKINNIKNELYYLKYWGSIVKQMTVYPCYPARSNHILLKVGGAVSMVLA
jgi:hypothetical protein